MKNLLMLCCVFLSLNLFSQGYWTQKADFGGTTKYWAVGFAINGKGYAGLGRGNGFANSSDLWEYNPVTNAWTQKSSFPGGARYSSHVFVINNKAYFCSGAYWSGISGDYTPYNDVWEYNPATDTWLQKNNFPGPGRHDAFAFSFAGHGYLCFGQDDNQVRLKDLWQYNPDTDSWTQKATFPDTARSGGIQFGFGKYGYIGLGRDNNNVSLGDVWRYDCSANTWTQMANFPSASRTSASTFVTNNRAYVVCGYNFQTSSYSPELWEYNPNTDTWIQREDFPPGDRACGTAFTINNKGYFGLGNVFSTFKKDFWEYTPSCLDTVNTTLTLSGTTIYANVPGAVYQWLNCDIGMAVIDNETNQSYAPPVNGNYAVIITQDVCRDTSDCIAINTIGIDELDYSGIRFFPNPSQGKIKLDLDNAKLESDIILTSMDGKIVEIYPATSVKNQEITIGDLSVGHYILSFVINNKRISKEIIISK